MLTSPIRNKGHALIEEGGFTAVKIRPGLPIKVHPSSVYLWPIVGVAMDDQDLLTKFSCMGTQDRDVLVSDLHDILGAQLSREGCVFFLEMTNWWVSPP